MNVILIIIFIICIMASLYNLSQASGTISKGIIRPQTQAERDLENLNKMQNYKFWRDFDE